MASDFNVECGRFNRFRQIWLMFLIMRASQKRTTSLTVYAVKSVHGAQIWTHLNRIFSCVC